MEPRTVGRSRACPSTGRSSSPPSSPVSASMMRNTPSSAERAYTRPSGAQPTSLTASSKRYSTSPVAVSTTTTPSKTPSTMRPISTPGVAGSTWGAVATEEPSYEYAPASKWPGAMSRRPRPIPSRCHREMIGSPRLRAVRDGAVRAHVDRSDVPVQRPDLLGGIERTVGEIEDADPPEPAGTIDAFLDSDMAIQLHWSGTRLRSVDQRTSLSGSTAISPKSLRRDHDPGVADGSAACADQCGTSMLAEMVADARIDHVDAVVEASDQEPAVAVERERGDGLLAARCDRGERAGSLSLAMPRVGRPRSTRALRRHCGNRRPR